MENVIRYFTEHTKTLFLVDGLGAVLTTFNLFFVLSHFHPYIGMPVHVLNYLSIIGLVFMVYSFACFLLLKGNWTPYLRAISIGNLTYCVLTMALVYLYLNQLTRLGVLYFVLEIVVIFLVVYVELRVASASEK